MADLIRCDGADDDKDSDRIAMYSPPKFVISIDLELRWGLHDVLGMDMSAYRANFLNGKEVVADVLSLFAKHGIRATWAAVGAIACNNWTEYFSRAPKAPRYKSTRLIFSPRFADLDANGELHFAPELLAAIPKTPGQDLGTHTFSHVYMREPGFSQDDCIADMDAVSGLWDERFGFQPISLVFPRNQTAYLDEIANAGIRIWRSNPRSWYFERWEDSTENFFARALRMVDAFNPFMRRASSCEPGHSRASMFLRFGLSEMAWKAHAAKVQMELERLSDDEEYHVWFHEHNLGGNARRSLARLEQIVSYVAERIQKGKLVSASMADLVALDGAAGGILKS